MAACEEKEANYIRLSILLIQECTAILKAVFDHHAPPQQLSIIINAHSKVFKSALTKKYINGSQYRLLYPNNKLPDSCGFDISLLVYLLRSVCKIGRQNKQWDEKDNNNIPDTVIDEVADIVRIRNVRNQMQHKSIASLENNEFQDMWLLLEKVMLRLANTYKLDVQEQKRKIDDVKTRNLDPISKAIRSLRANTANFLRDFEDETFYVETAVYQKAKEKLEKDNILILTGHPGEGKTNMAAKLAMNLSNTHNILNLAKPSDWREIDLSLKLIKTIIIDDIFGSVTLDDRLVGDWKPYLHEIERAAKENNIWIIITSRHHIFEESKEELEQSSIYKHSLLLTSSELSTEERTDILKNTADKYQTELPDTFIQQCVISSSEMISSQDQTFLFGFPECSSMFIRNEELRQKGHGFFKTPAQFFKRHLEKLFKGKNKDKFMALVLIWTKENKKLSLDEIKNITEVSDQIKQIVTKFRFDLSNEFLRKMYASLKSHNGGYLVFNENTDEYGFSHNVIGDMVGIVVGGEMPEETVHVCPKDFLMEYVTIDENESNEFKVVLKGKKIQAAVVKCTDVLIRRNCNQSEGTPVIENEEFKMLERTGKRSNVIQVINTLDFGIIKHTAFKSESFVDKFVKYVIEQKLLKEVFSTSVMRMKGYFLDYGISMTELDMRLVGYAWHSGVSVLAKYVIERRDIITDGYSGTQKTVSLLLATHSGKEDSVDYLIKNGAKITGDVIYIAAHKNTKLLEMLLKYPSANVNDRGNLINGNYPLIVAARKGLTEAVKCLLNNKADASVQNTVKMTALHKAILYKHTDIVDCLLDAGAPVCIKGGKFKRTPLHLAVDTGKTKYVRILLQNGKQVKSALKMKDYRGQYPLHIAAMQGHLKIVRLLFPVDTTQENLRITSYGTKSRIKGWSIFHVAVWKKNEKLVSALMTMDVDPNVRDFFGQTPLYFAIMQGQEKIALKFIRYTKTNKKQSQKQGFTPLHAAIHRNMETVSNELIKLSDVNAADKYGRTPLHVACEKVNLNIIKELLRNEADVRCATKRGDTVFHILRRQIRRQKKKESKNAEALLAEFDPEFYELLPGLKNRAGVVLKMFYKPVGISREKLLMRSPVKPVDQRSEDSADDKQESDGGESDSTVHSDNGDADESEDDGSSRMDSEDWDCGNEVFDYSDNDSDVSQDEYYENSNYDENNDMDFDDWEGGTDDESDEDFF